LAKARKKKVLDLSRLETEPPGDLHLPSLARNRVEGYANRYTIILPLLSNTGEEVYSLEHHLGPLVNLLANRFGGVTTSNPTHIPLHGFWLPEAEVLPDTGVHPSAEKDQNMIIRIYSRQVDNADLFFQYLKSALLDAALVKQDELLVEKTSVWLLEARSLPRKQSPTD
jgi:hypothetical protein